MKHALTLLTALLLGPLGRDPRRDSDFSGEFYREAMDVEPSLAG